MYEYIEIQEHVRSISSSDVNFKIMCNLCIYVLSGHCIIPTLVTLLPMLILIRVKKVKNVIMYVCQLTLILSFICVTRSE